MHLNVSSGSEFTKCLHIFFPIQLYNSWSTQQVQFLCDVFHSRVHAIAKHAEAFCVTGLVECTGNRASKM